MSWFESKCSGSFLSPESIRIKFQKSILSRELIWINSCKAIGSHELSGIKTFWDWIESNKEIESRVKIPNTKNDVSSKFGSVIGKIPKFWASYWVGSRKMSWTRSGSTVCIGQSQFGFVVGKDLPTQSPVRCRSLGLVRNNNCKRTIIHPMKNVEIQFFVIRWKPRQTRPAWAARIVM